MKRLYFIVTPLSLINAIEYRERHTSSGIQNILYICTSYFPTTQQLASLIKPSDWDSIEYLAPEANDGLGWIKTKLKVARVVRSACPEDEVFFGHLFNIFVRYLACRFVDIGYKIVYADDGLATLAHWEELSTTGKLEPNHSGQSIHSVVRQKLMFPSFPIPARSIKFFSFYELPPGRNYSVEKEKNNFTYLASGMRGKPTKMEFWFVGQPLVKLGILSHDSYCQYVDEAMASHRNKGRVTKYIPHRSEDIGSLPVCWNVTSLGQPLEYALINYRYMPEVIGGFYSSALVNLAHIFSNNLSVEFWYSHSLEVSDKQKIVWRYIRRISEFSDVNRVNTRWLSCPYDAGGL